MNNINNKYHNLTKIETKTLNKMAGSYKIYIIIMLQIFVMNLFQIYILQNKLNLDNLIGYYYTIDERFNIGDYNGDILENLNLFNLGEEHNVLNIKYIHGMVNKFDSQFTDFYTNYYMEYLKTGDLNILKNGIYENTKKIHLQEVQKYLSSYLQKITPENTFMKTDKDLFFDGLGWIPPQTYNYKERIWFKLQILDKEKIHISPQYIDQMTGEVVITISKQIYNENTHEYDFVYQMDFFLDITEFLNLIDINKF